MIIAYILLAALAPCWAGRRTVETSLRVELQPPEDTRRSSARHVRQSWMTMPVDHFDPHNRDTYQMQFFYNEEFFGGDGYPIFILVGGEWDIVPSWLQGGNMYLMAQENKGYQIYTEHRYYGRSLPYQDFTTENLRFLNVDQALADLAYFIKEIKQSPRFVNSKVVLYGGSYAANMVLWFKQRYPHLVLGTVASSGPILGKVDFTGYLEVVHEAFLSEGGEQCVTTIAQGIEDTVNALGSDEGRLSIGEAYRLCTALTTENRLELAVFAGLISWSFSTSVQQARPGSLIEICNNFSTEAYGTTPMQKIGGYIATTRSLGSSCWGVGYDSFISSYMRPSNSRAWYYQTCTEYGYYQTAPRTGTAFDKLEWLDVEFYVDVCKRIFDHRFNESFVAEAVDRVNLIFGGLEPDVNSTINIHGNIDPWRALGVYDRDLKESSPTYNVPR